MLPLCHRGPQKGTWNQILKLFIITVTTITFMVFCVMMNIVIYGPYLGVLGVWLFNGIKYLFHYPVGIVGIWSLFIFGELTCFGSHV